MPPQSISKGYRINYLQSRLASYRTAKPLPSTLHKYGSVRSTKFYLSRTLTYDIPANNKESCVFSPFFIFYFGQVSTQYGTRLATRRQKFDSIEQWKEYKEYIPSFDKSSFRANMLLEHMNTTKDSSDYLWYTFR